MYLKQIGCEVVDCITLARNNHWLALVNAGKGPLFP